MFLSFFVYFYVLPSVCVREDKGRKGDKRNGIERGQNGLMIWGLCVDWGGGFRSC